MSQRVDVQDALDTLLHGNTTSPRDIRTAVRIVGSYIEDLEQRARNVVQDADDAQQQSAAAKYSGHAWVTWQSVNALRATINFPRR